MTTKNRILVELTINVHIFTPCHRTMLHQRENSKLRMHLYFYVKINIFLLSQTSLLSTFCFVFQKQKQTIINAINCTFDSHVIYKDNDKGSVKILSFVKRNIYDYKRKSHYSNLFKNMNYICKQINKLDYIFNYS
jgi:hypothetical protein